jgi:hypothetical protein
MIVILKTCAPKNFHSHQSGDKRTDKRLQTAKLSYRGVCRRHTYILIVCLDLVVRTPIGVSKNCSKFSFSLTVNHEVTIKLLQLTVRDLI